MKIHGTFSQAAEYLKRFEHLSRIIDFSKLEWQVRTKYPSGIELGELEIPDIIITALLALDHSNKDSGLSESIIANVEYCIKELALDLGSDSKKLSEKICRLRTPQLWDTLTSLLLAKKIIRSLPQYKIELDYSLGISKKSNLPVCSDIAIQAPNGALELLINSVTPHPKAHVVDIEKQISDWIIKDYEETFSEYCIAHPQAKSAIIISLARNEEMYTRLQSKTGTGQKAPRVLQKNGLVFAIAGTFGCPDNAHLVLDTLVEYFAPGYAAISRAFL